ncbi:hypothetical protein SAMN02745133_02973 [Desulforamulus putei DSM 12395]|uniref:Uncharacterized protein n=1 Tax=Desulforamulus putei DSM 12395 TaxID=1121429 RepID=A0A1M5CMG9_9FIRM|nr:hypothetical protein [Desulforamulus putei]SHF55985.1 hypothetical protein SAMN02745133_02973 [Desulforamulus putei DSM 12395]
MDKISESIEAMGTMKLDKSISLVYGKDIDLAIKSLKKQVPKKPIDQSTWKACPTCNQGIGVNNKTPNPKAIAYCFHCGQKLDWD